VFRYSALAVDQVTVRKTMSIVTAHDLGTFAVGDRFVLDGKCHDLSTCRGDGNSKPFHTRIIELHLVLNIRHASRLRDFAMAGLLNSQVLEFL